MVNYLSKGTINNTFYKFLNIDYHLLSDLWQLCLCLHYDLKSKYVGLFR